MYPPYSASASVINTWPLYVSSMSLLCFEENSKYHIISLVNTSVCIFNIQGHFKNITTMPLLKLKEINTKNNSVMLTGLVSSTVNFKTE